MPAIVGSTWNLPNFIGELYSASPQNTPFLTLMGGPDGARTKVSKNFDFPTSVNYALLAPGQNVVSEQASLVAPAATSIQKAQVTNTCQIHQQAIRVSYNKLASMGRLNGLNTAGEMPEMDDELAFQIEQHLKQIANDMEFSFIQGTYLQAANSATVATTRGMNAVTQLGGGTSVDGAAGALDLTRMQTLFRNMFTAGADFEDVILYVPANLKQRISEIYGFAPADRQVGGLNIQQIETDFARVGVIASRYAPANTVLAIDVAKTYPVFQEVPDKGLLFYEELAKVGAAVSGQLYAQAGLDHGPAFAHGRIFNLA